MLANKAIRFSENLDYSFAIGRLRAQESYLFDHQRYERLIRATDIKDFLGVLADSRYFQFLDDASRLNPELIFRRAQAEILRFCLKYSREDWLQALLRLPVAVYNLKISFKQAYQEGAGSIADWQLPEPARGFARGRIWQELMVLINEGGAEAFLHAREKSDPALIDIFLDRLEHRLAMKLCAGQDYAQGYYRLFADLTNLLTALRLRLLGEDEKVLKQALLPGGTLLEKEILALVGTGEEKLELAFGSGIFAQIVSYGWKSAKEMGSLVLMEKKVRERLLDYVNTARYVALGYEPLFRFYRLLENELTNLRLLYAAKLAGLETEKCQDLVVYGF